MTAEQVSVYDSVVASAEGEETSSESSVARQNWHLAALWELRRVSLHPDLLAGGSIEIASNPRDSRVILQRSGKLAWLLYRLDEIKPVGEKVLVFCVQKKLQEALSHHLGLIYGLNVPIINGDTKATPRNDSEETRLGLIEQFSRREGFGICVLSPIAAGAGVNIVAANHIVHLERHWNPAKEDQATDRAYRIGQTRPVTIYLPVARHPNLERRPFDDVLHGLIEKKRELRNGSARSRGCQTLLRKCFGRFIPSSLPTYDRRRLSKRTLHAARICDVSVLDRSWLSAELDRMEIFLADLLAKDARRERVE